MGGTREAWSCPYEYRFYDFTDPGQGWPDLLIRDADGETMWLERDAAEDAMHEVEAPRGAMRSARQRAAAIERYLPH